MLKLFSQNAFTNNFDYNEIKLLISITIDYNLLELKKTKSLFGIFLAWDKISQVFLKRILTFNSFFEQWK